MQIEFDNRYLRELPEDPNTQNHCRYVHDACYSRVQPTPVSNPQLIAHSENVAHLLGFSNDFCQSEDFCQAFSGNQLLEGMSPYASCYGGHQFGGWAGQLGDGRAISLGEVRHDDQHWELQLKGAGPTPYSRQGDGRAVLRSSIREFLCSEAMHHLGIPTTRALCLIGTGDSVMRDMFYDGRAAYEPGAIVCRVAPSFLRFGNLQLFAARQELETQKILLDFLAKHYYPECVQAQTKDTYSSMFHSICLKTARLILGWLSVGFVHGVMNTDNMSLLGLTIDYGPYGWLDNYDPRWTPNTSDSTYRRYAYKEQGEIALWNLQQLAKALIPQVGATEPLVEGLDAYAESFNRGLLEQRTQKIGLKTHHDGLLKSLNIALQSTEVDMTLFFRGLANLSKALPVEASDQEFLKPVAQSLYGGSQAKTDELVLWLRDYHKALQAETATDSARKAQMDAVNPKYILRNYIAQVAIDKASLGDYTEIHTLLKVIQSPYEEQPEYERYSQKRPEWARNRPGCSALSCSS